ncbi:MAG: hypothetical protein ACPGGG_09580 [Parvibaculales bacterium]
MATLPKYKTRAVPAAFFQREYSSQLQPNVEVRRDARRKANERVAEQTDETSLEFHSCIGRLIRIAGNITDTVTAEHSRQKNNAANYLETYARELNEVSRNNNERWTPDAFRRNQSVQDFREKLTKKFRRNGELNDFQIENDLDEATMTGDNAFFSYGAKFSMILFEIIFIFWLLEEYYSPGVGVGMAFAFSMVTVICGLCAGRCWANALTQPSGVLAGVKPWHYGGIICFFVFAVTNYIILFLRIREKQAGLISGEIDAILFSDVPAVFASIETLEIALLIVASILFWLWGLSGYFWEGYEAYPGWRDRLKAYKNAKLAADEKRDEIVNNTEERIESNNLRFKETSDYLKTIIQSVDLAKIGIEHDARKLREEKADLQLEISAKMEIYFRAYDGLRRRNGRDGLTNDVLETWRIELADKIFPKEDEDDIENREIEQLIEKCEELTKKYEVVKQALEENQEKFRDDTEKFLRDLQNDLDKAENDAREGQWGGQAAEVAELFNVEESVRRA